MNTLVVLGAVLAAAVGRPSSVEVVPSTIPDIASSKAPTARTNNIPYTESNVDDISGVQIGRSLQSPVSGNHKTSNPINPALPSSFPVGNSSDGSTGPRIVDNPHIGLPFGTVLPLPDPVSLPEVPPTVSNEDPPITFIVDSPHVGLPPSYPTPEKPDAITVVSRPTSSFQTGATYDSDSSNSFHSILTEVPSKRDIVSDLTINSFPASLLVNSGAVTSSSLPKSPFVTDFFISKPLPVHSTHVFLPVGNPIPRVPVNAGLSAKSNSASLLLNNGNTDFLVSNPFSGLFTKSASPKFSSKSPTLVFTPSNSQGKSFHIVNSVTTNPPGNIPFNTVSLGFPSNSPISYPVHNVAFTVNNPPHSFPVNIPTSAVPITTSSSAVLANSANVLLFSRNAPFGNAVNTLHGPILVGRPANFAIFPQQPSLDVAHQVLAARKAPVAHVATAATGSAFSHAVSSSPDTIFFAGVPVQLGGSHYH